jgi:hypothetical protein
MVEVTGISAQAGGCSFNTEGGTYNIEGYGSILFVECKLTLINKTHDSRLPGVPLTPLFSPKRSL